MAGVGVNMVSVIGTIIGGMDGVHVQDVGTPATTSAPVEETVKRGFMSIPMHAGPVAIVVSPMIVIIAPEQPADTQGPPPTDNEGTAEYGPLLDGLTLRLNAPVGETVLLI